MPLLHSSYKAPFYLFNKHLQTIVPSELRRIKQIHYHRERISTPDHDFLDIDWLFATQKATQAVIVSHGLEGDTQRPYMKGMARALTIAGYDVATWNYRSCSGEMNLTRRLYHGGVTDDLETVIRHVIQKGYTSIHLVGFSLGANITLKYLGEKKYTSLASIGKAVVFSVPCDLKGSSQQLSSTLYKHIFLRDFRRKIKSKALQMPEHISTAGLKNMRFIADFDERYTAPLHGFASADDYYEKCSSRQFIPTISTPTLIINAQNDPFLSKGCFPIEEAQKYDTIYLEMPTGGGHCGFSNLYFNKQYWSEWRAIAFFQQYL
ncbi:MAG: alpha/beta hydrolase [Cytophagales bacterium]|nr:MAG: alpha/beta hydrolase [Cytophagales bacterium]